MSSSHTVSARARESYKGGPDDVGEEHLFVRFEKWLADDGWYLQQAQELSRALQKADYNKRIPPPSFRKVGFLTFQRGRLLPR